MYLLIHIRVGTFFRMIECKYLFFFSNRLLSGVLVVTHAELESSLYFIVHLTRDILRDGHATTHTT
jgi:hypothetical protein